MEVAKRTGEAPVKARAISHLQTLARKREAAGASRTGARRWEPPPRTELVKLLLAERNDNAAWTAFQEGSKPSYGRRWPLRTHPEDAIALYHRYLPFALDHGAGSARYDEAFGVVREIRALRVAHRQQPAFGAELEAIRKTYRAKRNFIKLLESWTRDSAGDRRRVWK